jgi:hypothetical protein
VSDHASPCPPGPGPLPQDGEDTSWHVAAVVADDVQAGLGPDSGAWPAELEDGARGLTVRHDGREVTGTFEEVRGWLAGSAGQPPAGEAAGASPAGADG